MINSVKNTEWAENKLFFILNIKKALILSAFFVSILPFLFLFPNICHAVSANTNCALTAKQHANETVTVARVFDGDTLQLKDGRIIRVIGINTPELGKRDHGHRIIRQPEPYARQASQFLRNLIKSNNVLQLRYDQELKDRHGRVLAHVILKGNRNLSALMLQKGFARALHIPPNNWQFRCYAKLDKHAQRNKIGLWSDHYFDVVNVNTIKPTKTSKPYNSQFLVVKGVVTKLNKTNNTIWIKLGTQFSIGIKTSSLGLFKNVQFKQLLGSTITARGYVIYYPTQKQSRMLVRHPSAMVIKK